MQEALKDALGTPVTRLRQLAGGASKDAWAVETADGREVIVRRAGGGVIHLDTLSLREEFEVLVAARAAGVHVPEPIAYIEDLEGREAFVMELVHGETIGRRIVKSPPPGLAVQMAEQIARIHSIPADALPFLPRPDPWQRLHAELDSVDEPHPAIELGIAWCRERLALERPRVVNHGDFRIGNLMIDDAGIVAVLDWEFAHLGDPAEDLGWPLIRAWRFGNDTLRLGGVGEVAPFLDRYAALTGISVDPEELLVWEVFSNCKWAIGALTQARRHLRGEERSVELAILGRLAAEMEYELLDLIDATTRGRSLSPPLGPQPGVGAADEGRGLGLGASALHHSDRPTAAELAAAVREFLETEILPTLDDHRLRFRALVSMNALSIVEREAPPPGDADWETAHRIRAGDARPTDLPELRAEVAAKLAVASPRFLERLRAERRR